MEKAQARKAIKRALARFSPEQRRTKSEAAARDLLALPEFHLAGTVMLFVSMDDEIDTLGIIAAALCTGKRVVLPKVDLTERTMESYEIADPARDLSLSAYGILEPVTEKLVPAEQIDFVLVPARGFDVHGQRLGRGAGYYDRYMSRPGFKAVKCGIAFDAQVLDDLPAEAHDVPVDILVTESRTVRC